MQILDHKLEDYLLHLLPQKDPQLRAIENYARQRHFQIGKRTIPFPIVGPLVGRLLIQLTTMIGAKRVLELGSGFGYSGYYFAKALGRKGELILTDYSKENLEKAKEFLRRVPNRPKLQFHCGDALALIKKFSGKFDIAFIDVDKQLYAEAFQKSAPLIRKGGLLIADNALWSGEVLKKNSRDAATQGIREFNRLIFSSPSFYSSILPLRDGVAICLKIK